MKSNKSIPFIKAVLTVLLFFTSTQIQYIFLELFGWKIETLTMSNQVILSLCADIVILLVLVVLYFKDLKKEWQKFRSDLSNNLDTGFKYWLIGILIMMGANLIINMINKNSVSGNEEVVQSMISSLPWIMLINTGLLAPMIEEITFRKTHYDTIHNEKVFVIVSGLVFGFLHVASFLTNPINLLYIIPYGALGSMFALMYKKTGSVFTSMSMHALHNTILTLLSILV